MILTYTSVDIESLSRGIDSQNYGVCILGYLNPQKDNKKCMNIIMEIEALRPQNVYSNFIFFAL